MGGPTEATLAEEEAFGSAEEGAAGGAVAITHSLRFTVRFDFNCSAKAFALVGRHDINLRGLISGTSGQRQMSVASR